jgi:FAD/FMN-containing dehydrogenase
MIPTLEMPTPVVVPTARALHDLRARFRGALLRPGEEGYDDARSVWNGGIDRRPAVVARCAGADDVVRAVRFARDCGLPASVRGGGHSVDGHAVCDGGVMIDLSMMRGVEVDSRTRVVRAAGGALVGAVPAGMMSQTGVAGLTLGGGLGHLVRRYGLTADNLLVVDMVTAEGERVRVDAEREPELFWGLRGGGGNFGVATALEFRAHPVGPLVLGGPVFWPLADARLVLGALDELLRDAPDELGLAFALRLAPPGSLLPASSVGRPVLGVVLSWTADIPIGERVLAPLRSLGTPLVDAVRPMPFVALQSLFDAAHPRGAHYDWRSQHVPALGGELADALVRHAGSITSPLSYVGALAVGGAAACVPADATAVAPRAAGYAFDVVSAWTPAGADPQWHVAWSRAGAELLRPHATSARAGSAARLSRLTALKARWDPTNFFRFNANVPPGRSEG